MRGHEPLLAMRRSGAVPQSVWLDLDPSDAWRNWPQMLGVQWREHPNAVGSAHVQIDADDSIARLDLRFLVGLTVWGQGTDAHRVEMLHRACAEAGAKRVLSSVMQPDTRGQLRCVAMLDTAGVFQGAC